MPTVLQNHNSPPPGSHRIDRPPPSSASPIRLAAACGGLSFSSSPFSLGRDSAIGSPMVQSNSHGELTAPQPLTRVRLSDILPYDGAPVGRYSRAVEALSGSLMRYNAAVIELGLEDAAVLRCGLESARFYFKTRVAAQGKGTRGVYIYRAGRPLEDVESSPPCMADVFQCMGRAARAALCAVARHLRLRSDVFNHLLDETPLPLNEPSSSILVATFSPSSTSQNGRGSSEGVKLPTTNEVEKGLLTLISSDTSGLQVCDPNSRWYLADNGLASGDLLLLTGKALSHVTGGLRPAATHRPTYDYYLGNTTMGRTSLAFRLMPQSSAILDCSPIIAAGHAIPQSYTPISVSQFLDDLSAEEDVFCNRTDNAYVVQDNLNKEQSLRAVLSDPLSGTFMEDATFVSCGHSFGGLMLRRVVETSRCTLCNAEIEPGSLIPNLVLRAAAAAVKYEDDKRLFYNASLRKRRKEENGEVFSENGPFKAIQYPFSVNEKVMIKGNRRTPDKFVGKEAVITSQCLNGWYLLKIIESGENVRLQYRSLQKFPASQETCGNERCHSQPLNSSS